jgi:hypothetical protein
MISVYMGHSGLHVVRVIGIGLPHGHIWILRRIVRFTYRRGRRLSWCAKAVEREVGGIHEFALFLSFFSMGRPLAGKPPHQ